jgi:hypothetical protein
MPEHKLIKSDDPMSVLGWVAIVAIVAFVAWIGSQDRKPEFNQCPRAGEGQLLIGRGHTEIDGETGELMCTYATSPTYASMVANSAR